MFYLYQVTGLFELAWRANPDMAATEISRMADAAHARGQVFIEDLLRRCIVNLAHGRPVGYFGDEEHPIELNPQVSMEQPVPAPQSEQKLTRRARRRAG